MNATATMPGTFAYSPAAGTVLAAGGTATLTVTFTRDDATRYILATASQSPVVCAATAAGPRVGRSRPDRGAHHADLLTWAARAPITRQ